ILLNMGKGGRGLSLRKLILFCLTVLLFLGSLGPVSTFAEGGVLPIEVIDQEQEDNKSVSLDERVTDYKTIEIEDGTLIPEDLTVTDSTYMFMLATKVSLVIYP